MTSAAITSPTLDLRCVVDDTLASTAFLMRNILSNSDVDDFKGVIWTQKKGLFENVKDASQLQLYLVTIPTGKGVADTLITVGNIEDKELLMGGATLSDYFPESSPLSTIHIIVEQPKAPKRDREDDDDDLKNAIVAAGLADKALEDGNPVLSGLDANEKTRLLEFLGRRVPLSDGYRSLLDTALSLKKAGHNMDDLKKFSTPNGRLLPVVGTQDLYIRQEYISLYKTIISQFKVPPTSLSQNRLVVAGTPGIGKSAFLVYFTIRLLAESDDIDPPFIIFHTKRSSKCFVFTGGSPQHSAVYSGVIEDFEDFISLPKTWYLVDSSPDPVLNKARTVISASPKTLREQYKEVEKESPDRYHMAPWELDELEECRASVRNFKVITKDFMKRLYVKMGGVPRYVLQTLAIVLGRNKRNTDKAIEEAYHRVKQAIEYV
ncbi:hypothetical protein BGX26_010023 [Mortierella sp. AD094]|nr:hypothetical protein BGX26_010023 [Mortierella sp. AD094]